MKTKISLGIVLFLLLQSCSTIDYLTESNSTLQKSTQEQIAKYSFKEQFKVLGHNSEPWETTDYSGNGVLWIGNNTFLKQDTLANSRGRKYTSITNYDDDTLCFIDYGDTELFSITEGFYFEKIINSARYSPTLILGYFIQNEARAELTTTYAVYSMKIGKYPVELFINTATKLVDKITYLSYDELYGDVITTFIYSGYVTKEELTYPSSIQIEKTNGNVNESIEVVAEEFVSSDFKLLEKSADYKLIEPSESKSPEIKVTKYNDFIHFVDLVHTDDKVMVVELDDYVLVAEAPINSENGELIISEVKKIAPSKPIKYFVFGHHHPHYLGGLRAFVHKEATILCTDISKEYVEYIASSPHTLQPDSLQLERKPLTIQIIKDSLILGETDQMIIYFIGEKSSHTKDFLIYYFPNEKMLFQDDLCWIPREADIKKAGARQAGLYNVIKEFELEVEIIIQSWPVKSHKVKTIIPFSDLEKSMLIEN